MTPNPSLHTLIDTLETFIGDLQDQGIRTVPCTGPLPDVSPAPVAARPAANAPPPPPPAPARPAPATPSPAVPSPAPDPAPSTAAPGLVTLHLLRMRECQDPHPPEQTALQLVIEPSELQGEPRDLLQSMLLAIGYALPETAEPLPAPPYPGTQAARILCMGENANEAFCTLQMGLSLVRGKWQTTPAGRMLATHAPSYLVNNPTGKRAAWNDLQKILQDLGLDVPEWTRKKLGK